MQDKRDYIVTLAQKFVGVPYIWGGSNPHIGFDCSGLMIWVLQVFGVLDSGDWTADGLSQLFEKRKADPWDRGDLVFYGKGKITHVMMYIGEQNSIGMVVGASGGDSTTTTEAKAKLRNAMVKIKPVRYRSDLMFAVNIDAPLNV